LKPDFVATRPLPDHQQRLEEQAWWRRRYRPNQVYVGQRLMCGVLSLTWMAWAAIGVLSGHMFFLVSRGGPIHWSGLPALLFCGAVLAAAAACGSVIVDHYDRRDNEAVYRRLKRGLWWGAAGLFGCAVLVGTGEKLSVLPWTDGRLGVLSGQALRELLHSESLSALLQPHVDALRRWLFYSTAWFLIGAFFLKKFEKHPQGSSVFAGLIAVLMILPVVTAFTLNLLADLASGQVAQDPGLREDEVKAKLAWTHSMLVGALGVWAFAAVACVLGLLRWLGVVARPPGLQKDGL
jgi:hypothetical protein